jgi:hypothetical protein
MSLTPLRSPYPRPRAQQQPVKAPPVSVPSVFAPSAPAAPEPSAEVQRRIAIETLTVADMTDLSIESLNALVPYRPDLIAALIIDAGEMRRGARPMRTSTMRPVARCIVLAGMRRRAEPLSDADEEFLAAFSESPGEAGA